MISIITLKNYYTGDVMEVRFNISNEGLGKPFHYWWRDRVVSRKLKRNYTFAPFNSSSYLFIICNCAVVALKTAFFVGQCCDS